jgi:uncharacterized YigZ family protein
MKNSVQQGYTVPADTIAVETTVVNSRFVCAIARTASVEDALAFIKSVKQLRSDADSHAYAYRIGHGGSVTDGCNDGGEPGGTAGRPMLAVVQGSGIGDITAVVTRYFGGTKLGTGGLVRAFGGAVKAALAVLPLTERIETVDLCLDVPYALFDRVRLILRKPGVTILGEDFGAQIRITLRMPVRDRESLNAELVEMSGGLIVAR